MKLSEIERAVAHIGDIKADAEEAHECEDKLYLKVLESIANGTCKQPRRCAKAALKANNIEFPRWYA